MNAVRPPAVAGLFYPGEAAQLRRTVLALLAGGSEAAAGRVGAAPPKILIVPHAGYVYSGTVAAAAFALLARFRRQIRRVVLLGPTHRVPVRGIAVPSARAFATPLGLVSLDRAAVDRLVSMPQVVVSDAAHAGEHCLEVQLPFLQVALDDFALVPLAVGHVAADAVVAAIEAVRGGDETVVLLSSDLSHYHPYAQAKAIDEASVRRVLACTGDLDHEQACGATPINAGIAVARTLGLQPRLLSMCNSGDTSGDRRRVVGYCSVAFEEPHHAAA